MSNEKLTQLNDLEAIIRRYRSSDLAACRALWVELTSHHREIYGDPGIGGAEPGRLFDQYMESEGLHGPWVAVKSDAIVGLVGLLVKGKEAEVEPVIVSKDVQGQGVGRKLIEHARVEAEQLEMRTLTVRPVARNASAIAFYVSLGFDIVGYIELFQELSGSKAHIWQEGLNIHGQALRF